MKQKEVANPRPNCKATVIFDWDGLKFEQMLKTCAISDDVIITLKHLNDKNARILEAGCGLGRIVRFLKDKGYKNVAGIELSKDSVDWLHQHQPDLEVACGDVLDMPYPDNSVDVMLSYGVIEHFYYDGPWVPLKAMHKKMKPGAIGIITVPSFNFMRRIFYAFSFLDPRKNNFIRKLCGKKPLHRNKKKFGFHINPEFKEDCADPEYKDFYEYRMTKRQFKRVCKESGFEILSTQPIAHIDGFMHCFGQKLVKHKDYEFHASPMGAFLNRLFSWIPYFHNHMQLCVVKKPLK